MASIASPTGSAEALVDMERRGIEQLWWVPPLCLLVAVCCFGMLPFMMGGTGGGPTIVAFVMCVALALGLSVGGRFSLTVGRRVAGLPTVILVMAANVLDFLLAVLLVAGAAGVWARWDG